MNEKHFLNKIFLICFFFQRNVYLYINDSLITILKINKTEMGRYIFYWLHIRNASILLLCKNVF